MKNVNSIFAKENINPRSIDSSRIDAYKGVYNRIFKPFLDFIFSVIFFIALIPFYIVIAAAIALETGTPVVYRAERGGYNGKPFKIYKFRTMVRDADKLGGGTTALNDCRITRVGSFLRKTKLDEFLQLLNIMKFEMSFVGPRPELTRYTNKYKGAEKLILKVRPGITDYSSIEYINLDEIVGAENADEHYEKFVLRKKNVLRLKYAATVSFSTDVRLMFLTMRKVVDKFFKVLTRRTAGSKKEKHERELAV